MCKHFAIINKTLKNEQLDKLQKEFTKTLVSEKDGIGRFFVGVTGTVKIERTLESFLPPISKNLSAILGETSKIEGSLDEITRFAVCHGRYSTNFKGIDQCHPIKTKKGLGTHNGVVSSTKFKNKFTKNDSELALYHLEARDFAGMTGYASLFYFDTVNNLFTVYRDDTAQLYLGVDKDENIFIVTNENFIKSLGVDYYTFPENTGIVFNLHGEIVEKFSLEIPQSRRALSSVESKALGYSGGYRWQDDEIVDDGLLSWEDDKKAIRGKPTKSRAKNKVKAHTTIYDKWIQNHKK